MTAAFTDRPSEQTPSLVGTWRLVSFVTTDGQGQARPFWDDRRRGAAHLGTVTHAIEGAMSPGWIGTELVRGYRFLGPDRVELRVLTSADRPAGGDTLLVWERVSR